MSPTMIRSDSLVPRVSAAHLHLIICLSIQVSTLLLFHEIPCVSTQSFGSEEFLSIDCGSSESTKYTDTLGIEWTPDSLQWQGIDLLSQKTTVTSSASFLLNGQSQYTKQYTTMRYFQKNNGMNETKFCYSLGPTIQGNHYLLRAAFWSGSTGLPYSTRAARVVQFYIIVDTYVVQEIVITLPQSDVWIEEMYVRAQSSVVMVCLSAASSTTDAPFINSLELRPLGVDYTLGVVAMVNSTKRPLRLVDRQNFGLDGSNPAVLRFPEDVYDRVWYRSTIAQGIAQSTPLPIDTGNTRGHPPQRVMQSVVLAKNFNYTITPSLSIAPLTRTTTIGQHKYYVPLYFCEINQDTVTAAGKRVFNASVSIGTSTLIAQTVDIFGALGAANKVLEVTSNGSDPVGPYSGDIDIRLVSNPTSLSASISAAEILQLVDEPVLIPTAFSDVIAIRDIGGLRNFSSLMGDPCLPLAFNYPWIGCTNETIPKVTSISLSNYGLRGKIPASINNLDRVLQIYLNQNSLEGPLPSELGNLARLQTLDLSNNNLNGEIPSSLASLPKLTYLNIANNNFSGDIPAALLQRKGLTFIYSGNNNLCGGQTICQSPPSKDPKPRTSIGMIVGIVAGVVVLIAVATLCYLKCRGGGQPPETPDRSGNIAAREYTLIDIVNATNNLVDQINGQGGFAPVYKGTLENGQPVAIKLLSAYSDAATPRFLSEVATLSSVRHPNLVQLVGYCNDQNQILIYEFMPNGPLRDALNSGIPQLERTLTWAERLGIVWGAAKGLAYLHEEHNPAIIHGDVRSTNILLSENLEGKLSDYGLNRPELLNESRVNQSTNWGADVGDMDLELGNSSQRLEFREPHIGGSRHFNRSSRHIDPELVGGSVLSKTADVYRFGIVLLEVVSGRQPITRDGPNQENITIVAWARGLRDRGMVRDIVDSRLGTNIDEPSMQKIVDVALACARVEGQARPTMAQVRDDIAEAMTLFSSHSGP